MQTTWQIIGAEKTGTALMTTEVETQLE